MLRKVQADITSSRERLNANSDRLVW